MEAATEGLRVAVDYWLLLLVFLTVPVTKLLHKLTRPVSSWAARLVTVPPEGKEVLRRDIAQLKAEIQPVNITDEFPKYARLKRNMTTKERALSEVENHHHSRLFRRQTVLNTVLFLLIEMVTLGIVLYHRSQPVISFPPHYLWPAASLLQFPTSVPGGIGLPAWALCVRQSFNLFSLLWRQDH